MSRFASILKTWYEPAAVPIYAVIALSTVGATYYLGRLMNGQDVAINMKKPMPFLNTNPDSLPTKFMMVSNKERYEAAFASRAAQLATLEAEYAAKQADEASL
ncbi:hypothetical protein H696_04548 [Fonticula alba]|uniref:Uncharacterized protein n=1 Tax=Fonticula alba TaxID=691883 RepID=A0A058Z5B9_FONAL|nr:hypothetical protein H696_04548 [Fonticula alba]KCV69133.1 hypothetical protein H696_04548 [Fonticula alba]|eukprot:XP_009496704.1 hypothetical protein H696_04548 [Fonticula alba]